MDESVIERVKSNLTLSWWKEKQLENRKTNQKKIRTRPEFIKEKLWIVRKNKRTKKNSLGTAKIFSAGYLKTSV